MKQFFNVSKQDIKINQNDVLVFSATFSNLENEYESFMLSLSSHEIQRSEKYKIEKARKEFVLSRGFLRQKLSLFLGQEASDLQIEVDFYGKPFVKNAPLDFYFNLSHSGDRLVLAVAKGFAVGIDVEKINTDQDLSLAQQVFSDQEIQELDCCPDYQKVQAFFKGWTQKEAYIKALGLGMSYPLKTFSVVLDPEVHAPPMNVVDGEMKHIQIDVEYSCSVFIRSKNSNIIMCE